jgi:GGDEF domain-containing protein
MRRLAWLSWAVGAVVCLAAPFLPDPDTSDHAAMAAFGAADKALYAAKAAGHRRVVAFGAGIGTALP